MKPIKKKKTRFFRKKECSKDINKIDNLSGNILSTVSIDNYFKSILEKEDGIEKLNNLLEKSQYQRLEGEQVDIPLPYNYKGNIINWFATCLKHLGMLNF